MIFEYAIDPELVAQWGSLSNYRYFLSAFGLGEPRVLGQLPKAKNWRRRVVSAAQGLGPMDLQRVTALAGLLLERSVPRDAPYNGDRTWLDNAEEEHARAPFRAILSASNPLSMPDVLTAEMIGVEHAKWPTSRAATPPRAADALANELGPLLRLATEVVLVDPHFAPHEMRYLRPLTALLKAMVVDRPVPAPVYVDVVTSSAKYSEIFLREKCKGFLPDRVPLGITLRVFRAAERDPAKEPQQAGAEPPEKLHQRYVLTNLGGVRVDPGLDDGDIGTYDLNLMEKAQFELRWKQYSRASSAFMYPDPVIEVVGKAPTSSNV